MDELSTLKFTNMVAAGNIVCEEKEAHQVCGPCAIDKKKEPSTTKAVIQEQEQPVESNIKEVRSKEVGMKRKRGWPSISHAWMAHVAEYRKKNGEKSYKDCLKEARDTYTCIPKKPKTTGQPSKWKLHVAQFRKDNPDIKNLKDVLQKCKMTYVTDKK